jgi:hypothetical protein
MDVKPAFLNGVLEEEVDIEQPFGYIKSGKEQNVLKLKDIVWTQAGTESMKYENLWIL